MTADTLSPLQAFALFEDDPAAVYVDVRTVAEFAVRHPKVETVRNIPFVFLHPTTKAIHPNESFLLVMNDVFAKDVRIIVGADEGSRAADAAAALVVDGFVNVSAMLEGLAGWVRSGLPVTADNRPGTSYVSLLTPAKRRRQVS